jgi:NhaA family Na+:H+ antiporter
MNLPELQPGHMPAAPTHLPEAPVQRWVRPFVRFLHVESASGIVLLLCTVVALALANSPWADTFAGLWKLPFRISVGPWGLDESLLHWLNDGLMTVFFFVVGLEIKRELVAGELRGPQQAVLPVIAALGGMVAPATLYLLLQGGRPGQAGWGIPMATDIAFVVGVLALLGPRVPFGLKILLLSLAIADDIGAILVIACFYATSISLVALGLATLGFGVIAFCNRIGVRSVPVYVAVGAGIWLAFVQSGVHPTVAGVLLGLLTPASAWIGDRTLLDVGSDLLRRLRGAHSGTAEDDRTHVLGQLARAAREGVSPLERLETALHPWVAFGIMPLFALANAGVRVELATLAHPVALAVAAGLVIGKPLGIVLFSWLAVRAGLARLPTGVTWMVLLGAGCLAGIGFTMSLFIAGLALEASALQAAKVGILSASVLCAAVGVALLCWLLPTPAPGRHHPPPGLDGHPPRARDR